MIDVCTKLIAELHSSGLSNENIGDLLSQHGGKRRDESVVRSWANRKSEPRVSDWIALQSIHSDVFKEHPEKSPILIKRATTETNSM